ncbi:hypothetical protein BB8028_0001g03830 [Beauveria bassiana]|uniref:Uncharacterized protein n=1 Tax=Beauveria bassiana TaxID=176275 RepID=A0A2S7XWL6_BEABA|nr:hypothetical protein BB8028_0001g03830 [Beauveria bassiana]
MRCRSFAYTTASQTNQAYTHDSATPSPMMETDNTHHQSDGSAALRGTRHWPWPRDSRRASRRRWRHGSLKEHECLARQTGTPSSSHSSSRSWLNNSRSPEDTDRSCSDTGHAGHVEGHGEELVHAADSYSLGLASSGIRSSTHSEEQQRRQRTVLKGRCNGIAPGASCGHPHDANGRSPWMVYDSRRT